MRIGAFDLRNVVGRRKVVEHRVHQVLDALVLEGRAGQDRRDSQRERARANCGLDLIDRALFALDKLLEQVIVELRDRLDHHFTASLRFFGQLGGNVADRQIARVFVPRVALHLDEVDDSMEVLLGPDRHLDRDGVGTQARAHRLDGVIEVRASPVHLVDERDPRDAVPVRLPPDRLGLGLHAGDATEHADRTIEHTQRTLHLRGEVHVPGCVDQADLVVLPRAGGRRGRDRDAALPLLVEVVHRGFAIVDLTRLVTAARDEQDPLADRGLARVDVGDDSDVAGQADSFVLLLLLRVRGRFFGGHGIGHWIYGSGAEECVVVQTTGARISIQRPSSETCSGPTALQVALVGALSTPGRALRAKKGSGS